MNKAIKKVLRNYCPNIPVLRKKLNNVKLREINKYTMQPEDVLSGEKFPEKQMEIVAHYSKIWPDYVKMLDEKLTEYIILRCETVKKRKDLERLRIHVLFVCLAYGFLPDEFFAYELEHKIPEERKSYISNKELNNYVYELNDIIDIDLFFDKYKTYQKFKRYYKRDAVCVEKQSDYKHFCNFVEMHSIFVQKNVGLSKGDSVELVDSRSCGKTVRQLFEEMLVNGKYIVEERVEQSACMSRLNPSSVNTVRCMTFGTKSGIKIGPCFLKVGQGKSFVDNGGKGGILIGIDNRMGELVTFGYDEFLKVYRKHPNTEVEFVGYQLPDWEQLLHLAAEMSSQVPKVRYIGWDFAHTDKGWLVIEGNGSSQIIGPQIVWKRGFKEDVECIINE